MVPLRLFRARAYAAGNAACLCVFAVLFGLVFFMAQFLQTGLGYGPLGAGLRLVPGWATLTVIAPFAGTLIRRFGERPLIAGGLTLFAAGLIWIALIARVGLPYPELVVPLVLAGAGASLAIPPTQSVVMTAVAPPTSARPPARSTCCASWAACSASRSARRCSPPTAATPRRPRSSAASARPWAPARRWRCSAPWPA